MLSYLRRMLQVKSSNKIREVSYANIIKTQLGSIVIIKIAKRKFNKWRDVIGTTIRPDGEGQIEKMGKNKKGKLVLK